VTDLLVERARRGDPDAFVALIEDRQVAMARLATAILGERRPPAPAGSRRSRQPVSVMPGPGTCGP
jgi:hypothetical protein